MESRPLAKGVPLDHQGSPYNAFQDSFSAFSTTSELIGYFENTGLANKLQLACVALSFDSDMGALLGRGSSSGFSVASLWILEKGPGTSLVVPGGPQGIKDPGG